MQVALDPNEVLKTMAAKAVEHGETLRQSVRDLTLRALSSRETTSDQINKVLQSVTSGVSQGAAASKLDPAQLFKDALAGMDEAVMKVVEANQIALGKLAGEGGDFEQSQFNKALGDVKQLEDQFIRSVQQAADGAGAQLKTAWGPVLQQMQAAGSQTGAQARAVAETFTRNINEQVQSSRETAFKTAHALTQNYSAVVSGVLMGLAEAYQQKGNVKS